jgi:hypothetical protein
MVATPVGFRCPDCARGPKPVQYQTSTPMLAKAVVVGVLAAVVAGAVWGYFPQWEFYCVLLLGFGVAESIARVTRYKRGTELQVVAMSCVVLGLLVARVVMAWHEPFLNLDLLFNHASEPAVRRAFQLEFVPDFLFMAIPFVISYVRFK